MSTIYLVNEVVDLGSNVVAAYTTKEKADAFCKDNNDEYTVAKLKALKKIDYTEQAAKQWIEAVGLPYFVESIELKE